MLCTIDIGTISVKLGEVGAGRVGRGVHEWGGLACLGTVLVRGCLF